MTQDTTQQISVNGQAAEANANPTTSVSPANVGPVEPTPIKKRPRLPRTIQWMDLPPPYDEMKIRVWVNFPNELAQEISSGDKEKVQNAVRQIFIEHNDWEDQDGNPLPPTSEEGFWAKIPTELAATMVTLLDLEGSKLPNLVRQNAQR